MSNLFLPVGVQVRVVASSRAVSRVQQSASMNVPSKRTTLWASPIVLGNGPKPPKNGGDRKSTRLNSSHSQISYAVFCLKKKKKKNPMTIYNLILLCTQDDHSDSCP